MSEPTARVTLVRTGKHTLSATIALRAGRVGAWSRSQLGVVLVDMWGWHPGFERLLSPEIRALIEQQHTCLDQNDWNEVPERLSAEILGSVEQPDQRCSRLHIEVHDAELLGDLPVGETFSWDSRVPAWGRS